jgi:ketosteroid isomerase-like protein
MQDFPLLASIRLGRARVERTPDETYRPKRLRQILEIRDGRIVRGELFYDAEELRKAQGTTK